MENILITGSNRGIGLALVEAYLARSNTHLIATCRNPEEATELQALAQKNPDRLTILALDVNDEATIEAVSRSVQQQFGSLDVLINNAGINPNVPEARNLGQFTGEGIGHVVTTNAISPVIVTQAFVDILKQSANPRVVMISSQMGSITRASGSSIAYRMSKAAMNMAAKVLSGMLNGITVITTHPGHVATDMGGSHAPVKPAQSAQGLATIIDNLTPVQNGKFYNYNGEEIPW
jgi:NAD(P)-dependent dehydrogenase (short-subunit alcohol dehydrogenase family)